MIAFASAVTRPDIYAACAQPGIARAAEPDSVVLAPPASGTIFESYNVLIDAAAPLEDLEALVLVHQDAEIVDADFCARVRAALAADSRIGVLGCVGAVGVRSIAWWEGSVALASFIHRYDDHGGGDLPAFSWTWGDAPPYARLGEVDTIDGFLMVLTPWVVRNLRFDESLGQLHGYDFDFCLQVRETGRTVATFDARAVHHHALAPFSDPEAWIAAHEAVARKWSGRMPEVGRQVGTWEQRARRAEAERDAADLVDHMNDLMLRARVHELHEIRRETVESLSWRLTRPLRLADRARRALRGPVR